MQPVPHPRWELSLSLGASYPATLHPTKSHQVSTWTYLTCSQGERGCHGCLFLCWKGSILTSCHRQAEKVPHWLASQWQQKQPNPWHVASARPSCPSPSLQLVLENICFILLHRSTSTKLLERFGCCAVGIGTEIRLIERVPISCCRRFMGFSGSSGCQSH